MSFRQFYTIGIVLNLYEYIYANTPNVRTIFDIPSLIYSFKFSYIMILYSYILYDFDIIIYENTVS